METLARVFSKRTFGHKCEMLACRWAEGKCVTVASNPALPRARGLLCREPTLAL
jgi:hypothetical protein